MTRYTKRPAKSFDDDWEPWEEQTPGLPDIQVDLQDAQPTGILDRDGNEFMRMPERIGFIRW